MNQPVDLPRIIPALLIDGRRLVKTLRFRKPTYVGDPLNAVRIFNEKEVDEILIQDIGAARRRTEPDYEYVEQLASECFMPLAYGGGISHVGHAARLIALGAEKVVVNTAAANRIELISELAERFGAQAVVASVDVRRRRLVGFQIRTAGGTRRVRRDFQEYLRQLELAGAGELLINSIDRDGTLSGFDQELIGLASEAVSIPVIAAGGASSLADFHSVVDEAGASAAAAGAMFVFTGRHRAVLITYPERRELVQAFGHAAETLPDEDDDAEDAQVLVRDVPKNS